VQDGPELHAELTALVRDGYSRHAYPRRIHVLDALPKTPSGKVQRYLLRSL
jgi:acetyl-CoA synthetase